MEKTAYIQRVILDVEQHMADTLHPEAIAVRHFFSLSQLYRDFNSNTDSIKEYIRKRRFSNGAYQSCIAFLRNDAYFETVEPETLAKAYRNPLTFLMA